MNTHLSEQKTPGLSGLRAFTFWHTFISINIIKVVFILAKYC